MSQNNPPFPQFPQPIKPVSTNPPPKFTPINPVHPPGTANDQTKQVYKPMDGQAIPQFKPIAPPANPGLGGSQFKPLSASQYSIPSFKPLNVTQFKPINAHPAPPGPTATGQPAPVPSTTISSPSQPSQPPQPSQPSMANPTAPQASHPSFSPPLQLGGATGSHNMNAQTEQWSGPSHHQTSSQPPAAQSFNTTTSLVQGVSNISLQTAHSGEKPMTSTPGTPAGGISALAQPPLQHPPSTYTASTSAPGRPTIGSQFQGQGPAQQGPGVQFKPIVSPASGFQPVSIPESGSGQIPTQIPRTGPTPHNAVPQVSSQPPFQSHVKQFQMPPTDAQQQQQQQQEHQQPHQHHLPQPQYHPPQSTSPAAPLLPPLPPVQMGTHTSVPTPVQTLPASNSFSTLPPQQQFPPSSLPPSDYQMQHPQRQPPPPSMPIAQPQHDVHGVIHSPYPNIPVASSNHPPLQPQQHMPQSGYQQHHQQQQPGEVPAYHNASPSHQQLPQHPHPHPHPPQPQPIQQVSSQHSQHQTPQTQSKIAVHQVPRMKESMDTTVFTTGQCACPPPAASDYIVVDNGSCSPRFMRSTLNAIAQHREKHKIVALPLGGIVQPLGEPGPGEAYVPVRDVSSTRAIGVIRQHKVELESTKSGGSGGGFLAALGFGSSKPSSSVTAPSGPSPRYGDSHSLSDAFYGDQSASGDMAGVDSSMSFHDDIKDPEVAQLLGPLRCFLCRAYANPYFKFISNGKQFTCNFCSTTQDTPPHFYSPLDNEDLRADRNTKLEFAKGSVEYIIHPAFAHRRQLSTHPTDVPLDDDLLIRLRTASSMDASYQSQPGKDTYSPYTQLAIGSGAAHPTLQSPSGPTEKQAKASAASKASSAEPSAGTTTPHYVFMLDVSRQSQDLGMLDCAILALSQATSALAERVPYARVSVVCFDDCIHIPRYSLDHKDFSFISMSDLSNPFLPIPSPSCFTPLNDADGYQLFLSMLQQIPEIFSHDTAPTWSNPSLFEAAAKVAYFLLYKTGGKVLSMACPPRLQGKSVYLTDDEMTLYQQPNNSFILLGAECAKVGVCFDLYLFSTNMDCGWYHIDELIRPTGGQLYYYRNFARHSDGDALTRDIRRNLLRNTGYSAVLTIRVSEGLQVKDYYGSMSVPTKSEVWMSAIDSDKAIGFSLEYLSQQLPSSKAYIQCAVMFTSVLGDVRIRVHTLRLDVVAELPAIYRHADISAIVNLQLKQSLLSFHPLQCYYQQQSIAYSCLESLAAYRQHCAKKSPATQLVLPESLKLLPLYIVGMVKNDLYREGLPVDQRAFLISYVRSIPVVGSSSFVVPRLYDLTGSMHLYNIIDPTMAHICPLVLREPDPTREAFNPDDDMMGEYVVDVERVHQLNAAHRIHDTNTNVIINHEEVRRVSFPSNLSLSSESLELHRIYLLDDTMNIYIWVGPMVPPALVQLLFKKVVSSTPISVNNVQKDHPVESLILRNLDATEHDEMSPQTNPYLDYGQRLLHKIYRMIDYLRANKALHQKIHVIQATGLPRAPAANAPNAAPAIRTMLEIIFSRKMVEDVTPITSSQYSTNTKPLTVTLSNGQTIKIPAASTIPASTRANCMSYVDYLVWAHKLITQRVD